MGTKLFSVTPISGGIHGAKGWFTQKGTPLRICWLLFCPSSPGRLCGGKRGPHVRCGGKREEPAVWNKYRDLLERYDEEKAFTGFSFLSRQEFYARARTAVAVVATGERENIPTSF